DSLPRAFLVPDMVEPGQGHVLNTYYDEKFDPLKKVVLSELVDFQSTPHFQGEVKEVTYRPNHVTVKTSQEGNGFLVLMDSYFPGWTVTVDGKEQKILRANHFYRAVQLSPGEHTLEFDFFPEGFKEGLIISGISLLILIVLPFCRPLKRASLGFPHTALTDLENKPEAQIVNGPTQIK
ncbi:MAG: YfhO family protein, partial [Nitrospinota bacterium]|nr:YfhO family protein [Nitrospinota bacterium]